MGGVLPALLHSTQYLTVVSLDGARSLSASLPGNLQPIKKNLSVHHRPRGPGLALRIASSYSENQQLGSRAPRTTQSAAVQSAVLLPRTAGSRRGREEARFFVHCGRAPASPPSSPLRPALAPPCPRLLHKLLLGMTAHLRRMFLEDARTREWPGLSNSIGTRRCTQPNPAANQWWSLLVGFPSGSLTCCRQPSPTFSAASFAGRPHRATRWQIRMAERRETWSQLWGAGAGAPINSATAG
jgi:hypothetical protein